MALNVILSLCMHGSNLHCMHLCSCVPGGMGISLFGWVRFNIFNYNLLFWNLFFFFTIICLSLICLLSDLSKIIFIKNEKRKETKIENSTFIWRNVSLSDIQTMLQCYAKRQWKNTPSGPNESLDLQKGLPPLWPGHFLLLSTVQLYLAIDRSCNTMRKRNM